LQYAERMMKLSPESLPWDFAGSIVKQSVADSFLDLYLHTAFRYILALRLAIFYDAPLAELEAIIEAGRPYSSAAVGLVYGVEWSLWTAVVATRSSNNLEDYVSAVEGLSAITTSEC
jgi:hypothetical protein